MATTQERIDRLVLCYSRPELHKITTHICSYPFKAYRDCTKVDIATAIAEKCEEPAMMDEMLFPADNSITDVDTFINLINGW